MFPDGCIEGLSSDTVTFGLDFYVLCVLPACMYVYHMCALCPQRSQEDIGFLELELLIIGTQWCWEPNQFLLMLLTVEPSLQS